MESENPIILWDKNLSLIRSNFVFSVSHNVVYKQLLPNVKSKRPDSLFTLLVWVHKKHKQDFHGKPVRKQSCREPRE